MSTTPHPPNRLLHSTSPYLLQHAHNPVHWQPWDTQSLEQSRREDKPIFLSIGYSACHWCHVMEREVFENPDIAAIMNAHFINIKVDREERPDLDDLYMLATQLMSGSGGWPMSVWLTPKLEPFYAGTYFPPTDAYNRPGFPKLELALADAWQNRRPDILAQAAKVVEAIRLHADESASNSSSPENLNLPALLAQATENFADKFDPTNGGLGTAPKFPPHQALHLWLSILRHPAAAKLPAKNLEMLREMTTKTLDAMMQGGIYDHVGGAFARYSTDEKWLVPHFEKMLYDNAQLAPAYALAAIQFHRPDYARIARQTLDFWLREMTAHTQTPIGNTTAAFFSTLDADSEGHEGKFYVWTQSQIRDALQNDSDANLIINHLGVTPHGNWHESPIENATVLSITKTLDQLLPIENRKSKIENPDHLQQRIDSLLVKLRTARSTRIPPHLDDKILTSWNGLMISALAITGRLLHEPRYLEAAHRAMGFLLTHHMLQGKKLIRSSNPRIEIENRKSKIENPPTPAFLEDHAFLLNGLMDLVESTSPTSLPGTMARKRALELADTLIKDFEDPTHGGFFFTSKSHDPLFAQMKNAGDNATPSANAIAIRALLRLARSSGKIQYRETATRAVNAFSTNIARRPDYFPTILQSLLEDADAQSHPAPLAAPLLEDPLLLPLEPAKNPAALLTLTAEPIPPLTSPTFTLNLQLTIAPGYHIQSNRPTDTERFATVARLRGELPLNSQNWTYPDNTPNGYSHTIPLTARCTLPASTPPGTYTFRATILAQPCNATSCLAPEKVSLDFPITLNVGGTPTP